MFHLIAAAALAGAVADQPSNQDLVECLAYLATAPEYAAVNDDDLAKDDDFLEAAQGTYCSDEVSPLWEIAHDRARARLGVPADGPIVRGQQATAEQEMKSILGQAWQEARILRAHPEPLSHERSTKFALAWLLDERHMKLTVTPYEKEFQCARQALRRSEVSNDDLSKGMMSAKFRKIVGPCGYEAVQKSISDKLHGRFPEMSADDIKGTTVFFLSQLTFWAALSEP